MAIALDDIALQAPANTRSTAFPRSVAANALALAGVALFFGLLAPVAQLGSGLVWLGRRLEQARPAL